MTMIDLYAKNPYQHDITEKVMGIDYNGGRRFVCGTIVDMEHRGSDNAYIVESEHGKDYSGTLYESSVEPFDEKVVLEEIRKDNRLTIRIVSHCGTAVYVEKDKKEIFSQDIEGDLEDPGELLESYEKLLKFLGFIPDHGRMCLRDGLMVLQFEENDTKK